MTTPETGRSRIRSETPRRRSRSFRRVRPGLDPLEPRRVLSGLLNGDFGISDPGDPGFGYTLRGGASISGGQGVLAESGATQPGIAQTFTIAPGTTALRFSIIAADLAANGSLDPIDAFEVALLDAGTGLPLVGPPVNLPNTDSLLNLQQNGEVYHAPGVTVPGAGGSGQVASLAFPVVVTVDLSGIAPGTEALVSFDLLGFGPSASSVRIDDLQLLSSGPPLLTLQLDPASDSGTTGDDLTRHDTVNLVGNTDPNQTVELDLNNDGSTDLTTTADATGLYRFDAITLAEGTSTLRVSTTNASGTTGATRTITLDTAPPTGALIAPVPDSTIQQDPGFIEVQWTDTGAAGLLESSFGPDDVTITGVDVDSAEPLGGGRVRYHYNADGDTLPRGTIRVTLVAGQVVDRADNPSPAGDASFVVADDVIPPPPPPPPPPPVPSGPVLSRLRRYGYHRQRTSLVLNFDRDLDAASARRAEHYVLVGAGRDGRIGTRDDRRIKLVSAVYDAAARAVVLRPVRRLSVFRPYQLRLIGTGPAGITDTTGHLLDGDGDGRAGGDHVVRFDRQILAGRAADLAPALRSDRRDV